MRAFSIFCGVVAFIALTTFVLVQPEATAVNNIHVINKYRASVKQSILPASTNDTVTKLALADLQQPRKQYKLNNCNCDQTVIDRWETSEKKILGLYITNKRNPIDTSTYLQGMLADPRALSGGIVYYEGKTAYYIIGNIGGVKPTPLSQYVIEPNHGKYVRYPQALLTNGDPLQQVLERKTNGKWKGVTSPQHDDPQLGPIMGDSKIIKPLIFSDSTRVGDIGKPWRWRNNNGQTPVTVKLREPRQTSFFYQSRTPGISTTQVRVATRGSFDKGSAAAQKLITRHADFTSIETLPTDGDISQASTETQRYLVQYAPSHLHNAQVYWHEMGHIIDFAYLTPKAHAAFTNLFKLSLDWKDCYPDPLSESSTRLGEDTEQEGCLPSEEVFADQFSFWATGNLKQRSGYNVPPLAARSQFTALIKEFTPPDMYLLPTGIVKQTLQHNCCHVETEHLNR